MIKKTSPINISKILAIYDAARKFMRKTGNLHQWSDNYPSLESLSQDMAENNSYVVLHNSIPVATFYFKIGEEPTYKNIYEGSWLNNEPYGVIHRAASDGSISGVMKIILDYCIRQVKNIRIDTHRDNHVMQNALLRYGFKYCGIIYLENGDERLAYQYSNQIKSLHKF